MMMEVCLNLPSYLESAEHHCNMFWPLNRSCLIKC